VLRELDRLVERGTPAAAAARSLADRFARVASSGEADEALVALATRRGWPVVTADRELQHRLVDRGVPVLVPRDRRRLELHGGRPRRRPRGNG